MYCRWARSVRTGVVHLQRDGSLLSLRTEIGGGKPPPTAEWYYPRRGGTTTGFQPVVSPPSRQVIRLTRVTFQWVRGLDGVHGGPLTYTTCNDLAPVLKHVYVWKGPGRRCYGAVFCEGSPRNVRAIFS